jgi:EAL domain-containing protein (putative c-di-GMP-specific phosphodiesterase class I)
VHQDPTRRRLVQAITDLCTDFGTQAVAEGVETEDERDALREIGCDLMQGYLFGKPAPAFVVPAGI